MGLHPPKTIEELESKLSAKIMYGFERMQESHNLLKTLLFWVIGAQSILDIILIVKLF